MPLPIRLVIADDHLLFRQGLKSLLKSEPEVTIVGETDRIDALPALLAQTPCDQLILDLQMERNVLADIEALAARLPVVVLTASEVPSDAVAAIRKGARAVVFKRFAVENLMEAIRTVAKGDVWLPASLQTHMAEQLRRPAMSLLSPREEDVARYVGLGLRNAEVARELSISEQTVKTHLNSIFRKLGVRDRLELALYIQRAGIGAGKRRS
ncbi:MAG TPA: response regulator transcription factor [Candidatus Dormibacteraeota bacterium]|nr:response regulator transcription factor [Candidatus Dormibacteraeota bacterium]